jgi:hypothetical protein
MGHLGEERYSEILERYHRLCSRILVDRGGKPDDPQGNDGLMCYFGFPVAFVVAGCTASGGAVAAPSAEHTKPGY